MRSKHTIRKAGCFAPNLTLLAREPASKHTRDVELSFAVRSQERQSYTFFYRSFLDKHAALDSPYLNCLKRELLKNCRCRPPMKFGPAVHFGRSTYWCAAPGRKGRKVWCFAPGSASGRCLTSLAALSTKHTLSSLLSPFMSSLLSPFASSWCCAPDLTSFLSPFMSSYICFLVRRLLCCLDS